MLTGGGTGDSRAACILKFMAVAAPGGLRQGLSGKKMSNFLSRCKPGVPIRIHLLVAALVWTLVGFFLMTNGYLLLALAGRAWLVFPALLLGTGKAWWIMDRMARKNCDRLVAMQDGACLGSVYSFKTWGLVVLMIVLGRFLRRSLLPAEVVGTLYMAIGWALFWASRLQWLRWWQTG